MCSIGNTRYVPITGPTLSADWSFPKREVAKNNREITARCPRRHVSVANVETMDYSKICIMPIGGYYLTLRDCNRAPN